MEMAKSNQDVYDMQLNHFEAERKRMEKTLDKSKLYAHYIIIQYNK